MNQMISKAVLALAVLVCVAITAPCVTAQLNMTDEEEEIFFLTASTYRMVGQLEGQMEIASIFIGSFNETAPETSYLKNTYNEIVDQYNEVANDLNEIMEGYFGEDVPEDLVLPQKSYI